MENITLRNLTNTFIQYGLGNDSLFHAFESIDDYIKYGFDDYVYNTSKVITEGTTRVEVEKITDKALEPRQLAFGLMATVVTFNISRMLRTQPLNDIHKLRLLNTPAYVEYLSDNSEFFQYIENPKYAERFILEILIAKDLGVNDLRDYNTKESYITKFPDYGAYSIEQFIMAIVSVFNEVDKFIDNNISKSTFVIKQADELLDKVVDTHVLDLVEFMTAIDEIMNEPYEHRRTYESDYPFKEVSARLLSVYTLQRIMAKLDIKAYELPKDISKIKDVDLEQAYLQFASNKFAHFTTKNERNIDRFVYAPFDLQLFAVHILESLGINLIKATDDAIECVVFKNAIDYNHYKETSFYKTDKLINTIINFYKFLNAPSLFYINPKTQFIYYGEDDNKHDIGYYNIIHKATDNYIIPNKESMRFEWGVSDELIDYETRYQPFEERLIHYLTEPIASDEFYRNFLPTYTLEECKEFQQHIIDTCKNSKKYNTKAYPKYLNDLILSYVNESVNDRLDYNK